MAKSHEIASFECGVCGSTLESWNTAIETPTEARRTDQRSGWQRVPAR
jgi:hypothetical protein